MKLKDVDSKRQNFIISVVLLLIPMIALACRFMKLTPAQAIAAATINAAAAIRMQDKVGSLEPGKQADLLILKIPDYRHLGYRFGENLVDTVIKKGKVIHFHE